MSHLHATHTLVITTELYRCKTFICCSLLRTVKSLCNMRCRKVTWLVTSRQTTYCTSLHNPRGEKVCKLSKTAVTTIKTVHNSIYELTSKRLIILHFHFNIQFRDLNDSNYLNSEVMLINFLKSL